MFKRLVGLTAGVTALGFLIAVLLPAHVSTQGAQGARKPDQEVKGERSRGRGPDTNVKNDAATNDAAKPSDAVKPGAKTGETSRQSLCSVMFDNYADLYIKTFVDGRFKGTVAPYGELYTYAIAGPTILYARADYTDGSSVTWGPYKVSCTSSYTLRLRN